MANNDVLSGTHTVLWGGTALSKLRKLDAQTKSRVFLAFLIWRCKMPVTVAPVQQLTLAGAVNHPLLATGKETSGKKLVKTPNVCKESSYTNSGHFV
jgi:hypothetical protein